MNDLSFDKPAGVLVKTTLVDFPGIVAGSFFLKGCNLRCPYCYNKGLINNSDSDSTYVTINQLFSHLKKRQGILHGLVISGGEPLLNPYTPFIIREAKSLGYKIKLDTNGTLPYELEVFLNNPELKPDFVAMDIKTSPEKYSTLLANPHSKFYNHPEYYKNALSKSIELISSFSPEHREFRTVLVPPLIGKSEIQIIGEMLPKDANWKFAQFQNINCLNDEYNNIQPYTDIEIDELIKTGKSIINNCELR